MPKAIEMRRKIEVNEVDSSVIKSIGYNKNVLVVEFHNGSLYRYNDFPKDLYDMFMAAESKGRFFVKNIRPKFERK